MRGISYLVMAALLIALMVIGYYSYFIYALNNQIPTSKIDTIGNQIKNKIGIIMFNGDLLFAHSLSGKDIELDSILMVYPSGEVYKVATGLDITLSPFKVSVIDFRALGLDLPNGYTYDDFTFIFVDKDGRRYVINSIESSPSGEGVEDEGPGSNLRGYSGIITDVPIEIRGEYERHRWTHDEDPCGDEAEHCIRLRPSGEGRGYYRILPDVIYVNGTPVYIDELSMNKHGKGSIWDVVYDMEGTNIAFLNFLCGIDNGCDGTDSTYTVKLEIVGVMLVDGEEVPFYWLGTYTVKFEYKHGELKEIEFEEEGD